MGWGVGVRRQVIDDSSATDQGRHDSIDRSMEWNPTDCTARVVMHGQPSQSTQHSARIALDGLPACRRRPLQPAASERAGEDGASSHRRSSSQHPTPFPLA